MASEAPALDRKTAVPALIGDPREFLIVAGLAGSAKDVASLTAGAPNAFIMAGAMGGATCMGLGLALARPERRVVVVTGDGELLMNLGSLATVGVMRPPNLAIVCVDNAIYGETGNQASHTGSGVDLAAMAEAAGIPIARTIARDSELGGGAELLRRSNAASFILLKVSGAPPPRFKRSLHAAPDRSAFRLALLGEAAGG